jgi:hypothetical protein
LVLLLDSIHRSETTLPLAFLPANPVLIHAAGFIELARYRAIRHSGLVAKWEAASAANPKVDYTDAEFVQPMSIW